MATPSSASPSGAAMRGGDASYDRMADTMLGASESTMTPTADTRSVDSVVPTDAQRLHEFLKAGSYKSFQRKESEKHPSRGPHAKFNWPVRVYLDAKIDASLAAGNASHPAGSSIVKEMYSADGSELVGWAVMVKTQADSAGGQGWFWYETTNTEDKQGHCRGWQRRAPLLRLPLHGQRLCLDEVSANVVLDFASMLDGPRRKARDLSFFLGSVRFCA